MISSGQLLAFALASLVLIVIPGPGVLFVVGRALAHIAWGLAASGMRAWFARSPHRFALVGGAGGLAMIGVGVTVAITGRKD